MNWSYSEVIVPQDIVSVLVRYCKGAPLQKVHWGWDARV